jgi:hypothetical protein
MTLSHLNEDHENDLNCHLTTVTLVSSVFLASLSARKNPPLASYSCEKQTLLLGELCSTQCPLSDLARVRKCSIFRLCSWPLPWLDAEWRLCAMRSLRRSWKMRTTSWSPALIAMPDSRNHSSSKSARKSLQWVRPPGTALCAPPDVFVLRQHLASKLAWWKDADACWQILRTIRHGVHLEFARKPRQFQARPIPVLDRWCPWLHQELDRAIAAGAYEAATCTDFVAPAFIIEQRNKLRLVINF